MDGARALACSDSSARTLCVRARVCVCVAERARNKAIRRPHIAKVGNLLLQPSPCKYIIAMLCKYHFLVDSMSQCTYVTATNP